MIQTLYNNVKMGLSGPDMDNVERLDLGYLPLVHHFMKSGLQVDPTHFEKMEKILIADMDSITEKIRDLTGVYLNVASADQVADLLFDKLGLHPAKSKKTPTGKRETVDDNVLTAIQHEHPAVGLVQDYREFDKLRGTYAVPLRKLAQRVNFTEWRMFPNITTTRVPSGRNAVKEPNLVAMPNRTERGRQLCEGFITNPGWVYLSVDFSQIEPRVGAHRSGDAALVNVYKDNQDIYSDFATAAFKLPDERWQCGGYHPNLPKFRPDRRAQFHVCDNPEHNEPSWHYPTVHKKKHRFPAKTCTLASLYEVSGPGLLQQMPVICKNCDLESNKHTCGKFVPQWNEDNCQDLINAFYMKYSGLMNMRRMDHATARKWAYIYDDFGRVLHVTAVRSVLPWVVSAALREAGNLPLQGTARGIVKLGETIAWDDFNDLGLLEVCNPVLDIHDELLMEVREDMVEEIGAHVVGRFENVCRLKVPVRASTAQAECWGKMPK